MNIFQIFNSYGLTILMVTHEPEMARFTDRIVTLRDGLIRSDHREDAMSAGAALAEWTDVDDARSEERRVGKEGREWGWRDRRMERKKTGRNGGTDGSAQRRSRA